MDTKLTNDYFIHLRLTDILNMHEIQSILLKFWHLAYRYDPNKSGLASKITFSNCFIYEMNVDAYKQFLNCINESLKYVVNYKNFSLIANYLNTTNPKQVSYETFGLHILQLFGNLIKQLNENQLLTILRRVYFAISSFDLIGKAQVLNIQDIRPIQINDIINFQIQVRSKQNLVTPTKDFENDEHLPSLLDSAQRSNINAYMSNTKRQSQNRQKNNSFYQNSNYGNLDNQILNIKNDTQENSNNTLEDFNIKTNIQNFSTKNQANQSANKQDSTQQQFSNPAQQKSRNQIQSPTPYNQVTLSNQSSNFQELFQPYHMRIQPLKKNNTQNQQQDGFVQQNNHYGQNESKDFKRRSISFNNQNSWGNTTMKDRFDKKIQAIQENDKIRKELNNSFSACYPLEDKMKNQKKANLSSFVLGGYDIIDYSDTINKLHRKLLRKIILNR